MADIFKVLFDDVDTIQKIVSVTKLGFDYSGLKVYWNELLQGPMSQDTIDKVGGWTFDQNNKLVYDQVKFDANIAKILAKKKAQKLKALDIALDASLSNNYPTGRMILAAFPLLAGLLGTDKSIFDMLFNHTTKYNTLKTSITNASTATALDAIVIDFSDVTW